jgi:photosystem II stability/assembly factor-like uncharacterized protein
VLILAGTRKGLFLLRGNRGAAWEVEGPLLKGWQIFHAILHDGAIGVAANNWVYGGTFQSSPDLGKTWERSEQLGFPEEGELKLGETWHVEPGREDGELWLGAAPGALFRSSNSGESWDTVSGLVEHPTRERWQPGAGGMCTHSIQLDPSDPGRVYVAISAAGVFRSDDGGETWEPKNQGTAADFLPEKYPDLGQCVHKLLLHPERPERLWQQNHCGVYRSDDRGETWDRLDGNGLPSDFGFPIALDPDDPDVAYVVPEEGAENRVTPDGRLGIYKTADGGQSWELASDGLPEPAWASIKREGLAFDRGGVYLGTQSGAVYALDTKAGRWSQAASDLPEILSVEVAEWS